MMEQHAATLDSYTGTEHRLEQEKKELQTKKISLQDTLVNRITASEEERGQLAVQLFDEFKLK